MKNEYQEAYNKLSDYLFEDKTISNYDKKRI